jgi:(2R)-3-sulfolactate dehydrogenase (NADP+)
MLDLVRALEAEPRVRLPGSRRLDARTRAARDGITVAARLHREIEALTENPP